MSHLDALKALLKASERQLDQSATHDGLENCRILAEARAALPVLKTREQERAKMLKALRQMVQAFYGVAQTPREVEFMMFAVSVIREAEEES